MRLGTPRPVRILTILALATCIAATAPAGTSLPPADDAWIRVNTPHFILFGNVDEARLSEVARAAERFRQSLLTATAGLTRTSPLPTYFFVFRKRESFEPYVLGADGKPKQIDGYFVAAPDRNFVAMDATRKEPAFRIVAHEYVHYVVDNNIPGSPTWLDEGLAEFYSTLAQTSAGSVARMGDPIREHLALLRTRDPLPLARLFAVTPSSPEYNESDRQGIFYAQSWLLVHWLIVDDEARRGRFNEFVNGLRGGPAAAGALETALGMDTASIESALREYAQRATLGFFTFESKEPEDLAPTRAVAVARAEILARLGELLLTGEGPSLAAAEQHFQAALALDETNATARMAQGRLDRLRDKWDAACRSFEAALKMGGAAARTQYGWTLLDRWIAEHPDGTSIESGLPPPLLRARDLFQQALKLAPDDALALHGIGRTYRFTSENPAPGLLALDRARALLPHRSAVTADWIALTAAAGRIDAAREALENDLRLHGAAPTILRDAEAGIAAAEVSRAAALAEGGHVDEGRAILETALEHAQDSRVRALLAENLAEFHDFSAKQALIATFNQASDAARKGDFERARRLYEQVAATAEDADLRQSAAEMARAAKEQAVGNRVSARVAKAMARADGGEVGPALADIEAILRDESGMSDRVRAEVHQLRDRLQARLRR